MDEEIKAQLIPILVNTREGLAAAVEELKEQAPLLVKELLWWEGVHSAIWFMLGVVCLLSLTLFAKKQWKWAMRVCEAEDGTSVLLTVITQGAILLPGIVLMMENLVWFQILIAPHVFLLEYIAKWV